jgi:hypothetical protein
MKTKVKKKLLLLLKSNFKGLKPDICGLKEEKRVSF